MRQDALLGGLILWMLGDASSEPNHGYARRTRVRSRTSEDKVGCSGPSGA